MGLIGKIQARLELKRLEQRYVSRKNRNTWMSDAVYVDGEYVFPSGGPPTLTFEPSAPPVKPSSSSSTNSSSWSWSSKGPAARFREFKRRMPSMQH